MMFLPSLRKCNDCTVRFFYKYLVIIKTDYLLRIMLGRLNARTRFRAMAEAPIPLSTISLAETSSSQPVDREFQTSTNSKNLIHSFFFALLKMLIFIFILLLSV